VRSGGSIGKHGSSGHKRERTEMRGKKSERDGLKNNKNHTYAFKFTRDIRVNTRKIFNLNGKKLDLQ